MILKLRKKFIKIAMISVICVLFGIIAFINIFNFVNVRQNANLRLEMITEMNGQMQENLPPGMGENPAESSGMGADGAPYPDRDVPSGGNRDLDDTLAPEQTDDDSDRDDDIDASDDSDQNDDIETSDDSDRDDDLDTGTDSQSNDDFDFPDFDDIGNVGFGSGGFLQGGMSAESRYDSRYFTVTVDETGAVQSTDTRYIASVSESDAGEYAAIVYARGKSVGFYKSYRYRIIRSDEDNTTTLFFLNCERELMSFRNFLVISIIISVIGVALVFFLVLVLSKKAIRPIAENYQKQKTFITDAGHELKTPLTIIGAYAEMIDMDDPGNEYAAGIRNQVKRLTDLTNNLIYLSKTEEGDYTFDMTDFNLSEEIHEALIPYCDMAAKEHKTLSEQVEEHITFHGDQQTIRRLMTLLLDNAMKYTSEEGEITVRLSRAGSTITLQVENTVDEIEKGNLDILFERFYRRDASRNSATGGSGIGLSTAKAIVESHHGTIHADSPDGHNFIITIQWKL